MSEKIVQLNEEVIQESVQRETQGNCYRAESHETAGDCQKSVGRNRGNADLL